MPDLYCWLPADHGFRLSSKKLSLACLSDVGSSCIYMHLSRTNAAGFQREALPIVSMFARFHPWWTQVQVPSSPTSVSSSNEVRKFSLLNLELSLAVGQLQQTLLRRALRAPILQAPSIRTSLASRSKGQGDFCRLDGEAE